MEATARQDCRYKVRFFMIKNPTSLQIKKFIFLLFSHLQLMTGLSYKGNYFDYLRKKKKMKTFLFSLLLAFLWQAAAAVPTTLLVRAQAKDAKFIGSSIGGARILVKETSTGKIMADGFTNGSTGNTRQIMQEPHTRHQPLADAETAGFTALLDIDAPVFVTVEAHAPWSQPQARIKVETQLWIIPGKNISGDGLVLEFPGFVVDILSPQTHESIAAGKAIPITANVVMMCGCPVTEGGIWDASGYEVAAIVQKDGEQQQEVPLQITEKASTFHAELIPEAPGLYQVTVYAYDPTTGNTGVNIKNFIVK